MGFGHRRAVILIYTFFGGFLAVCWTDFIQGFMMLIALMVVPFFAVSVMGALEKPKPFSTAWAPTF